jgi:hypothetical protein
VCTKGTCLCMGIKVLQPVRLKGIFDNQDSIDDRSDDL